MGKEIKKIVFALCLLVPLALSAQNGERKDSLVRLISAESLQLIEKGTNHYRKAIDATFLHNGTYLICDTAQWYVEDRLIRAEGHVKVIQEGTILTGDNLDYLIDESLVQFRGSVVQLQDENHNTLRTRYLDYNTRDSVAYFQKGGAMKDKDGQIIESIDGSYDSKTKVFNFRNKVNMFTDSIFVKTEELDYESEPSRAVFKSDIDFWKDGDMLSAEGGWYSRPSETFFFTGHVHSLSKDQEAWSDSLYYYRNTKNLHLLGNAQVQDTTRSVFALAGSIYYEDSLKQVTLTRDAAVALDTQRDVRELHAVPDSTVESGIGYDTVKRAKADTMYFGADKIVYRSIRKFEIPEGELKCAKARMDEIHVDAVAEYRKKAAEAAAQAEAQKREQYAGQNESEAKKAAEQAAADKEAKKAKKAKKGDKDDAAAVEPASAPDNSPVAAAPVDSTALKAAKDSAARADSLAKIAIPDSSKLGFLDAMGNVKIFRYDLQVHCDSLRYNDLDSIARFYIDPVIWNDGNRQYTADSLYVLICDRKAERASLMSNAFIITQETDDLFDQIRATEVMAYFDSTSALRRFDALGGANAIFFLKEKEEHATANKVECKMLSATFADGDLRQIYYYDSPQNDAYPIPQLPRADRSLKGFKWRPEEQPKGKEDITSLSVRPSERLAFEARPHATFVQTNIYFPGYMKKVYGEIDTRKAQKAAAPKKQKQAEKEKGAPAEEMAAQPSDTLNNKIGPVPGVIGDSSAVVKPLTDTLAVADSLGTKAAEPEMTAAEKRRAAREARWAELDLRDAAKAQAKLEKKQAKQAARDKKIREKQRVQDEKDRRKLEKYIARYRKKYERKNKKNGKDSGQVSEVRQSGHPEQRGEPDSAVDGKTAEPTAAPKE